MSAVLNPHRFAPPPSGGGAMPTFIGLSTIGGSTTATSIDFSSSGRQAGDLLVVAMETANQSVAIPAGFATFSSSPQGISTANAATIWASRLTMGWKISDGTENTVPIDDGGDHVLAVGLVFRGVNTGAPIDVEAGNELTSSSQAYIAPSVTTTGANRLVCSVVSHVNRFSTTLDAPSNANLASVTQRLFAETGAGNNGIIAAATGEKAAAGPTGTTTFQFSRVGRGGMITFALRPA